MNILLLFFYMLLIIYAFLKKRDYVLAIILVGQPIIKMMLKPFPSNINDNIALLIYFAIGFFSLAIIRLVNRKKLKVDISTKKQIGLYLLFSLITLISIIYTPDKSYGISKSIEFISTSFLIIIVTILTIDSEENLYKSMKAIANIAILIGAITILLAYIKTGGLMVRIGTTQSKEIEVLGVNFAVSIWFGRRMGIGLLSMLFVNSISRSKKNLFKTIILLIMLILSGSRGPILSMIFTILVIIFLNTNKTNINRKYYKKLLRWMIVCLMIVATIIIANGKSTLTRLIWMDDSNISSRLSMYLFSIDLIKSNILGYGIGSFPSKANYLHKYPHNIILEIFTELGIQGLVVFILSIFISIRSCISNIKKTNSRYLSSYINFAFSVLLFSLINALFSGDIISNEYIWFGFILIGRCTNLTNDRNTG